MGFEDVSLLQAVVRLNRTSDRPVVLQGEGLADLRVSGAFDYGDAEGFGRAVAALYGLTVEARSDAVILQSAGR
jgi:transmembrane sensor